MPASLLAKARDLKSFNDNIAKSNGRIQKFEATNIGPNDISIQDIDQRMAGGFGPGCTLPHISERNL
jgi:hypothetical protein